jgi:uncharacterized RDD family membrane protein YckC
MSAVLPKGMLEVVGPEGVALRFEAASVAERFTAYLFDLFLVGLGCLVLYIFGVFATVVTGLAEPLALVIAAAWVTWKFYFILFEVHWQGATPGKRILGLKVVSDDGSGLPTESIIARNLMRDLEVFLPLQILFAPEQVVGDAPWWLAFPTGLWILAMVSLPFFTRENTRAGDLVGGTRVVRVPKAALRRDEAVRHSQPPGAPAHDAWTFTVAQLSIYGEHELETLAELLRDAQHGKARPEDLQVVARTIAQKIGFTGSAPLEDPRRFLRAFYEQQRAYLERKLLYGQRKASKLDG